MRRGIVFLLSAIIALPAPASAADLRLGLAVEPDSIDPHYHNFGGNKGLMPTCSRRSPRRTPRTI